MRRLLVLVMLAAVIGLLASACGDAGSTSSPSPASTAPKADLTREGAHLVQVALESWAVDHGRYPTAEVVTSAGVWQAAGMDSSWPENPWTAGPMAQGTGPGDFTYTVAPGRKHAKLVLYGDDGQALQTLTFGQ